MNLRLQHIHILAPLLVLMATVHSQEHRPYWFNRACSHYGEIDDSFGGYIEEVKPQVVIAGNFGPSYWSAVSYARQKKVDQLWTALGGGPVDRQWLKSLIERAHRNDIKYVGLFCLSKTFGHLDKPGGVFKFIDEDWDSSILGRKPSVRAIDMLSKMPGGGLWKEDVYRVEGGSEFWGCVSNPHWREMLKRMVSAAIELGVDGFHIVFPQRPDCICEHCQQSFRGWLDGRFNAEELKKEFQIADLTTHKFDIINGWYEQEAASPYALECLKFSQSTLKECYDEVFIEHGRALKPDLILGQWNHIYRSSYAGPGQLAGTFAQLNADERCVLPTKLWGRNEDFVWYSIGNWRMYDVPDERSFSDFGLERKYLYEAGGGKPAAVKIDDPVRINATFAGAAAHGGFAYPRGPNYRDDETRKVVKKWFDFLERNEDIYRGASSHAEAALVWNRRAVHTGETRQTADFKRLGRLLTKNHVLYDVVIDDNLSLERLKRYRLVLVPSELALTDEHTNALNEFAQTGGRAVVCRQAKSGKSALNAAELPSKELQEITPVAWQNFVPYLDAWLPVRSGISASDTISFTCFRLPRRPRSRTDRFAVHLVNYLRDRRPVKGVSGAALERPIAARDIPVRLVLPKEMCARKVTLHSPEAEDQKLSFESSDGEVSFIVPEILVYGAIEIEAR